MPNTAPAIWSAVAASFAALSSFLIMLIQRRNLLESARPELVLVGWNRKTISSGDSAFDVISVQSIRNVGRGPALNVVVNASPKNCHTDRPTASLSTRNLPILAANESEEINGEIFLWWENVDADAHGRKHLGVGIDIICWDSRGMRHQTFYGLFAHKHPENVYAPDAAAPGVIVGARTTKTTPVWWLKVLGRIRGLRMPTQTAEPSSALEPATESATNGESSAPVP
jgi:hypothetical protein